MKLPQLLRRGSVGCVLCASIASYAQVCDWCYTLQAGSRTDRIILAGTWETVTWSTARVNGEVDHWIINFNAGAATIECRPDPNDPLQGTWTEIGGFGNCLTGSMYLIEGDYGIAVYFEKTCGGYLSYFETAPSNLEMVGISTERALAAKCVCWPPQAASCTTDECNESASCGTNGGCQWRHVWKINTEGV
jgi:hypothetical protein